MNEFKEFCFVLGLIFFLFNMAVSFSACMGLKSNPSNKQKAEAFFCIPLFILGALLGFTAALTEVCGITISFKKDNK